MFLTEIIAYPLPSSNEFEEIKKCKACVQCTRLVKYEFMRSRKYYHSIAFYFPCSHSFSNITSTQSIVPIDIQ